MKLFRDMNKFNKELAFTMENENIEGSIKSHLHENISLVKETTGNSSDVIIREFYMGEKGDIPVGLFYTDGLVDSLFMQDVILKTLMVDIRRASLQKTAAIRQEVFRLIKDYSVAAGSVREITSFQEFYKALLSGDMILQIDGYNHGLVIDARKWQERGVTEPTSQTVVRGPKEGFSENIRINTALIRRRIKTPKLWMETKYIGRKTETQVVMAYIHGVVNDKIVDEVRRRLDKIDIDGILESGYIEELIQDETYTPFPTMYNTERPDVVAAALLEGRVAILVDGTPFVLLAPALFTQFFQSPEDYYQRFDIATLIRIIRYLCFFLTLLTPSLYIAITTFHQEMLPTPLLISIAAQREGVPFPALIEALLMEITFEILREAGIRMPRAIGPAISIVGALVLGEAAVQAGIVSPGMVIVVSVTAISSFVFPTYNMPVAIRMLRFVFMIVGSAFGLFGIALGIITLILHLCSLRSFGVPYMSPVAPHSKDSYEDVILRFPMWSMFSRPHLISQKNTTRQQAPSEAKPEPPEKKK